MATTEKRLYIKGVKTLRELEIQFTPPELEVSRNVTMATIQIVGRNTPIYQYTAGETTLPLQLDFHAEQENLRDVIDKCRWLESLTYNDGASLPPEKIMLIFGDLFGTQVWTVKSCKYKLTQFRKDKNYLPQQAYCDLVLGLDPNKNLRRRDVL